MSLINKYRDALVQMRGYVRHWRDDVACNLLPLDSSLANADKIVADILEIQPDIPEWTISIRPEGNANGKDSDRPYIAVWLKTDAAAREELVFSRYLHQHPHSSVEELLKDVDTWVSGFIKGPQYSTPELKIKKTTAPMIWEGVTHRAAKDSPREFTRLEMEGALCAWEDMIENRDQKPYAPLFEALGTAAMRDCSIKAGSIASHVYDRMKDQNYDFTEAYDWDFVPAVLYRLDWEKLILESQYGGDRYEVQVDAILDQMMKEAPQKFHNSWLEEAEQEADNQWAYSDLINDHSESFISAMKSGLSPAEAVKHIGEKYDLTPRSDWELHSYSPD